MIPSVSVTIEIRSYWRVGTGRGAAGRLDSLCARDRHGLPYLPGRSLKGLLRDAVERAAAWGWYDDDPAVSSVAEPLVTRLFGEPGFRMTSQGALDPVLTPASGCLQFANASLPENDRWWLCHKPKLIQQLFQAANATAIDQETGAPKHQTLRAEEVAVPMTLIGEITAGSQTPKDWDWPDLLRKAAPLVRALGSGKSRGLGRCRIIIGDRP